MSESVRYEMKDGWVCKVGPKGEIMICSELKPVGRSKSDEGEWQLIIEFKDLDGSTHKASVKIGDLDGSGACYRKELLSYGLLINPEAKVEFRDYLSHCYINTTTI
jgi:hypothetical protein